MLDIYLIIAAIVLLALIIVMLIIFLSMYGRNQSLDDATKYVLLGVSQTRDAEDKRTAIERVQVFEELITSITPSEKPVCFEIAIPNEDDDIHFFIAVPEAVVENVKTQVRRVYNRAEVRKISDYSIFADKNHNVFYDVFLKDYYGTPIKTYKTSERDTFSSLIGALSNAKEPGSGAVIQFVVKSASSSKAGDIKSVIGQLKKGKKMKQIKPKDLFDRIETFFGSLSELFSSGKKNDKGEPEVKKEPEPDSDRIKLMEEKLSKKLYDVNIRLGVSSSDSEKTRVLAEPLKDLFSQFKVGDSNGFEVKKREDRKVKVSLIFRLFDKSTASVLNSEEIASLFHLPDSQLEIKNVKWQKTRQTYASSELSSEGILLGDNVFQGKTKEIYLPKEDRLRHLYMIGQTGTGKSATMKTMAYQDILNDEGLCIIDPHGELVDELITILPEHRLDDTIIFDASDVNNSIALNMLEYNRDRPEEKSFIADEILSIFKKIFKDSPEGLGPMFEQAMRNSVLLLMEGKTDVPATLMDVPRVFTDSEFRKSLLANCQNQPVIDYWKREIVKVTGDASLENLTPYITSKFSNFITNAYVRPIIEQPHSSFSFRELMDQGKLLFVKLPKGNIGELNTQLLGMLVIGKLTLAALSRDNVSAEERRDFYLYIDEFQNFTSGSIGTILSEARKYRLGLIIGHQYMGQLTDDLRGAVLGNVGSIIAFRVGTEDAETLEKKFAPNFTAADLSSTENLNAVVSMLSNNKPIDPFTMQIRFSPKGNQEAVQKIKEYSRIKLKQAI